MSQFIIDKLSIIDYEMYDIKGEKNVPPDVLSRFPLLGPNKLTGTGSKNVIDIILTSIVGTRVDPSRLWVYVGKETKFLIDDIQVWRHSLNKVAQNTPPQREQCYGPDLDLKYPKVKIYPGHLGPRLGQGNRTMLHSVRNRRTVCMPDTQRPSGTYTQGQSGCDQQGNSQKGRGIVKNHTFMTRDDVDNNYTE